MFGSLTLPVPSPKLCHLLKLTVLLLFLAIFGVPCKISSEKKILLFLQNLKSIVGGNGELFKVLSGRVM